MPTLALIYSVAEYCCPVWFNSVRKSKVNIKLNNAIRIITGTLRLTPMLWLFVLASIHIPIFEDRRHTKDNGRNIVKEKHSNTPVV